MLDQESVKTYQSIRLTRDLRGEILRQHAEKKSLLTRLTPQKILRPAAALCSFVLIAVILFAAAMQSGDGVYIGETKIGTRASAAQTQPVSFIGGAMRTYVSPEDSTSLPTETAAQCIPLTLQYGEDAYITVSGGSLLLPGPDGICIFAGQAGEVTDGGAAFWAVDGCDTAVSHTAQILNKSGEPLTALTLTYDAEKGIWLIAESKPKK